MLTSIFSINTIEVPNLSPVARRGVTSDWGEVYGRRTDGMYLGRSNVRIAFYNYD
jgi:hypothetical protein